MKTLYVLFDAQCALCRQCRRWLAGQPSFVELRFLPLQSEEVPCRFPGIERFQPREQLVVVSDEGDVYQGSHAWIMCLWALREYRAWAQRLASPALLPLARRACEVVSENRLGLSRWFERLDNAALGEQLAAKQSDDCGNDCRYGVELL